MVVRCSISIRQSTRCFHFISNAADQNKQHRPDNRNMFFSNSAVNMASGHSTDHDFLKVLANSNGANGVTGGGTSSSNCLGKGKNVSHAMNRIMATWYRNLALSRRSRHPPSEIIRTSSDSPSCLLAYFSLYHLLLLSAISSFPLATSWIRYCGAKSRVAAY